MAGAALGAGGVVPYQLRATDGKPASSDAAVIFMLLAGGPPHMEMYDLKPDAPSEYRGEFRPIKTVVPGVEVSEYLPLHAKVADRFAIIRSISHTHSDHGGGLKRLLTGREPVTPVVSNNEFPWVGSMVARVRESRPFRVPQYVSMIDAGREASDGFHLGSSYLGQATRPFPVAGDPSLPDFEVQDLTLNPQFQAGAGERLSLLERLDRTPSAHDPSGGMHARDVFQRRAIALLTADEARSAFDLSREPVAVRDRYGRHAWGQRTLLARRLVEAGASFVTIAMVTPVPGQKAPDGATYNWDSHPVNCNIFTDSKWRFQFYDQAVTALIEDLYARGLDRRVLLVATGEFGRTPRISYANGNPGRDHWPQAMSVLVSGGGLKMGQVIGSTNARGEHPLDRPLTPNDLWATMFRQLGIDHNHTSFLDYSQRPIPILPSGEPIAELL